MDIIKGYISEVMGRFVFPKVDITDGNQTVEANNSDYEWFQKYLQPYLKSSTLKDSYHLYCVWYDGFAV